MVREYEALSWKEIMNLDKKEKIYLLLPIASIEQHGPQLPVGTDDYMCQMNLEDLLGCEDVDPEVLVLPAIHYGLSAEHMAFSGTVTLSPVTLIHIVEDIASCISIHGFKKLILFNSHGGNTSLLHGIAQTLKTKYGLEIYHIDFWGAGMFERAAEYLKTPPELDAHGGEIETSILMHTGKVRLNDEEIASQKDFAVPLPRNRGSWTSAELSDTGAIGGVSLSSRESGEKLRKFMLEDVVRQLNSLDGQ